MSATETPTTSPWYTRWWLYWWLVGGVSIFLHGPIPLYSTRTLAVAWDMWRLGEWWVPHINGAPYSHKTPLLYWLYHAGWAVFGVNDVWPRVVQLGIAAAAMAAAARLAKLIYPRLAGATTLVPWVFMGTAFLFLYALQLMFDVLLAAWVLLALIALVRGGIDQPRAHWPLFALAVFGGLMTKGPVMLLHVAFPLLLGPWWHAQAKAQPGRWYGFGVLALLAGFAAFAAWFLPAAWAGGNAYREQLLWKQTAGRVVQSFDHARPWWWYGIAAPLALLPWAAWPKTWFALARDARPDDLGTRLLIAWLVPVMVVFSLVSGKQAYYIVPEAAGFAIALVAACQRAALRGDRGHRAWGLAAAFLILGFGGFLLTWLSASGVMRAPFSLGVLKGHVGYGLLIVGLAGVFLLWRARDWRDTLARIGLASLLATAGAHAQFTLTGWDRYDLRATAQYLGEAQAQGKPVLNLTVYEGQYHFLGRLTQPIASLPWREGHTWASANPNGLIVQYPNHASDEARAKAVLRQRFRGDWIEVWRADDWLREFAPEGTLPPQP